jgi:hypothetical protein
MQFVGNPNLLFTRSDSDQVSYLIVHFIPATSVEVDSMQAKLHRPETLPDAKACRTFTDPGDALHFSRLCMALSATGTTFGGTVRPGTRFRVHP